MNGNREICAYIPLIERFRNPQMNGENAIVIDVIDVVFDDYLIYTQVSQKFIKAASYELEKA